MNVRGIIKAMTITAAAMTLAACYYQPLQPKQMAESNKVKVYFSGDHYPSGYQTVGPLMVKMNYPFEGSWVTVDPALDRFKQKVLWLGGNAAIDVKCSKTPAHSIIDYHTGSVKLACSGLVVKYPTDETLYRH
ncbi:MAG: hypothetical protein CMF50_05715 [Legionellales bacterium]|nr:hypothetical protein [Legionellales bacterium]